MSSAMPPNSTGTAFTSMARVRVDTSAIRPISVGEMAEHAGTIPWEILCGIGRRVPRVHLAGHDIVAVSSLLPPVKDVAMGPDPAKAGGKQKKVVDVEAAVKAPTPESGEVP